ncbi:hypothetical protein DFQ27_009403 [Actinomortierella ambigua]|uniref:LYR motif-containing protein Cup1-like N-terminal domain-containing protein n=1 Tax=Actinomortierella ambigua TaxID=1343610 RepID=A0A9P6U9T9_9FUNG|nr:hypothetical protein DFQ27_009403 [Actinomortierella ambigua]
MPTFAPVPESFKRLSHRGEVLYLYRHILKQAAAFFDERASEWMVNSARSGFRKNIQQQDPARQHKKLSDARKALRTIERANNIDKKAVERILRLAYGIDGKERQVRLQPFVQTARVRTHSALALSNAIAQASPSTLTWSPTLPTSPQPSSSSSSPPHSLSSGSFHNTQLQSELILHLLPPSALEAPKPLHFQYERSIPPIHSPAIVPLLKAATSGRARRQATVDPPDLPESTIKPLHGKREANLRWRYFTKLVRRSQPPVPASLVREIEFKARLGLPKHFASPRPQVGVVESSPSPSPASTLSTSTSTSIVTPTHYHDGDDDCFPAEWEDWERQLLDGLRAHRKRHEAQRNRRWEDDKYYPPSIGGKPAQAHVLTLRFYRRLWERLLDDAPLLHTRWTETRAAEGVKKKSEGEGDRGSDRAGKSVASEAAKSAATVAAPSSTAIPSPTVGEKSPSRVPIFSIGHSRYSASSKKTAQAVGLRATISDFDRIGFDPSNLVESRQPLRGKTSKATTTTTSEPYPTGSAVKE